MSKQKKKNTFAEYWLDTDMENMAYIFEYCRYFCNKFFSVDIDVEKFLNAFMRSKLRETAEKGHPQLLSEAAQDTIIKFIEVDCNKNAEQFRLTGEANHYRKDQLYWVGMTYSYLGFMEDMHCKDLIELIPLETMLGYYRIGHEMTLSVFHSNIKNVFNNKDKVDKQR